MAVPGVGSGGNTTVIPPDKTGFNALTSQDFLKLLVTQLQNQDPTQPVGNEELLNQLSAMRTLQSNIEMGDAMKAITTNQQLSTAAGFIGRTVSGTDLAGKALTGVVDKAFLTDGEAYVRVNNTPMKLDAVLEVEQD
jgi:flagellar basal-body rod modification protein FlgD